MEKRSQIHKDDLAFNRQQFALVFTMELLQVVTSSLGEIDATAVFSSFVHMFKKANLPLPDGLAQFPHIPIDVNDAAPIDIKDVVKTNFDAIGVKLISMENNRELLIDLGAALSGLEQLSSTS